MKETIGGVSYLVSPTAFFQTNVGARARYWSSWCVEGASGRRRRVLRSLSAAAGCSRLPLAQAAGATVTAVEENRQAVKDAEANIRLNRLPRRASPLSSARASKTRCRALAATVGRRGARSAAAGMPARRARRRLRTIRPQRAVYVSCNPDALAQDLPVILKAGYRVTHVQAVDMFPHTDHIETVAVFTRG